MADQVSEPRVSDAPGLGRRGPAASGANPDTGRTGRRFITRGRLAHWGVLATSLVVLIVVWWLVTDVLHMFERQILPSPGAVWSAFVEANTMHPLVEGSDRMIRGEFNYFMWEHLLVSLQRIGMGVGLAVVVGIPLGLVMASSTWVGRILDPYLNFLRSLPPLAYIGLLVAWFGIGETNKIVMLFLAAFPPIAMATISGVKGVKEDQINAVLSMGASRRQAMTSVVLPATTPEIITGIRVAVGFAWTTVVAAELVDGVPGIGGLAFQGGNQIRPDLVIACIIVIGLTAICLDALIRAIEHVLAPWRGKA